MGFLGGLDLSVGALDRAAMCAASAVLPRDVIEVIPE